MRRAALVVLAKAPRAGLSKTRLCPPCTPHEAATLARAALADTLDAMLATPAARHVLALDGPVGEWIPAGVEVIVQRGRGLDERLAHAFADVGEPALLVGMDTPQVTATELAGGLGALMTPGMDAVLGPAPDGGYWAIGLRAPRTDAFLGVPMSNPHTGRAQLARLHALGLRVELLPALRDVDRIADAHAVAALAPRGRFARALAATAAA
jgi:rSAM/selenodomain-associated transferase 1